MHVPSLVPDPAGANAVDPRTADATTLARQLTASRADTLAVHARQAAALADGRVPRHETLNPPAWELGHVGWFQDWWIARNPARDQGATADPDLPRHPPARADADALYDSARVPHATRWSLPLPDMAATRADLAAQLAATQALLAVAPPTDAGLYFYRLALLHEDMHHEAALYMAQSLGLSIDDPRWQPRPLVGARTELLFDAGPWRLGQAGPGFAFDNELSAHVQPLPATRIDTRVLSWDDYLPFVDAGGYRDPRWWGPAGRTWLAGSGQSAPRYLRRDAQGWQQWHGGIWSTLDPGLPACHLTAHEGEAWCRWAGRRLPTEAEWERAAIERADAFEWGQVWEWTASVFAPYPGFEVHPYRDYSAPWFGDRPVLRGASWMTQPRLRHPRYRNFFLPHRNDLAAGFRSCAA